MTFADSSLVKGFLSAAKTGWPITTGNHQENLLHDRHPTPHRH
ncbi:uncharacterized protein METZ01_LOCUS197543 [marine metagenome]|jgi:hypothetical protein|uniref:Uncharacterized protein n=1 Tax=marine metagenome TaxID=408172 RepID=A0A382E2N0_9ZZZZ